MQNKRFMKTVKHDLLFGIRSNQFKFLLILLLFVSLSIVFFSGISSVSHTNLVNGSATITDCWISFFKGMGVYVPSPKNPFQVPIVWIMVQVLISFIIFHYPTQDLYTHGIQILTRSKSRLTWWISKCIWVITTVVICYVIAFITACVFALIFGQFSLIPNLSINKVINEMDLKNLISPQLFIVIFLLPILTSIVMALLQMMLSFILSPIISYLLIMCYLIASAYYCSPALIGNFSMIMRNQMLDPRCSNTITGVTIDCSLILITIIIGIFYFRKFDILKKS